MLGFIRGSRPPRPQNVTYEAPKNEAEHKFMPPAPPAGAPKKLPEMHVNIFAFIGLDNERVKQTINEMKENFDEDYNIYFHINFNQLGKQAQNEKRNETNV